MKCELEENIVAAVGLANGPPFTFNPTTNKFEGRSAATLFVHASPKRRKQSSLEDMGGIVTQRPQVPMPKPTATVMKEKT